MDLQLIHRVADTTDRGDGGFAGGGDSARSAVLNEAFGLAVKADGVLSRACSRRLGVALGRQARVGSYPVRSGAAQPSTGAVMCRAVRSLISAVVCMAVAPVASAAAAPPT